jgi:hypothetical protein
LTAALSGGHALAVAKGYFGGWVGSDRSNERGNQIACFCNLSILLIEKIGSQLLIVVGLKICKSSANYQIKYG